jgi:uncharacterized membrane protein YfhO
VRKAMTNMGTYVLAQNVFLGFLSLMILITYALAKPEEVFKSTADILVFTLATVVCLIMVLSGPIAIYLKSKKWP